jgi:hypothetical protein
VSNPPKPSETDGCCQPGDITVTKVPTGYLIGRALPQMGLGPWWEYVGVVTTLDDAKTMAKHYAELGGGRMWLHLDGDRYEPLPD